jgi:hypothetical protein
MGRRVVEGVNSSMMYLIHYKNFCKPHNVLLPRITLKRKKEKRWIDWKTAGMGHSWESCYITT